MMNEKYILTAVHKEFYVEVAFATDTQSSYYQRYVQGFSKLWSWLFYFQNMLDKVRMYFQAGSWTDKKNNHEGTYWCA